MTSKERVLAATMHREADRIPLFYRDVPEVADRLLKDLGLNNRDELLEHFGIDFRWVGPDYIGPSLDLPNGNRKNIFGVEYKYMQASHGGHWEPVSFPLEDAEEKDLDEWQWPSVNWYDFSVMEEQFEKYRDYATMTAPGVDTSPGVLTVVQDLVGMERMMMDMIAEPKFLHAISDKVMEFNLAFIERLYAQAGSRIDFYRIGEDYGTQRGLLFGVDHWKEFVRPTVTRMMEIPRQHGSYYYQHTCGSVKTLIPHLIEAGVDVLDPIQVKAVDMDPAVLKSEYGDQLCFSGGVDEQDLLPKGSPDDVRKNVRELLEVMAPGGGFFVGPTHNFQADIPTANIVAMYEEARKFRL